MISTVDDYMGLSNFRTVLAGLSLIFTAEFLTGKCASCPENDMLQLRYEK